MASAEPTAAGSRRGSISAVLTSYSAREWDRLALWLIVTGAVLRLVVLLVHSPMDYVYSDMAGYIDRARALAGDRGPYRGDAFNPLGTHVLLAGPMFVFGTGRSGLSWDAAMWWALSSIVPLSAWRLASELFAPATAALCAGLCAFSPLFVTYGGFFTSEIPSLAFLTTGLWLGYRGRRAPPQKQALLGVAAGLVLGAAVLVRPQFLLNLLVLVVPLLYARRTHARLVTAIVVAAALVIGAGVVRNAQLPGHPAVLAENGGLNFYKAYCPVQEINLGGGAWFSSPVAVVLNRGKDVYFPNLHEWEQRVWLGKGRRCATHAPLRTAWYALRNVADATLTTVPWPQSQEIALSRIADVGNVMYVLLLPIIVFGGIRLWRRRDRYSSGAGILLAHLACLVPVALVFGGEPRYRVPYDVFGFALLAAVVATWRWPDDQRGSHQPTA